LSATQNWSHRREVNDFVTGIRKARIPAPFLQTVAAEDQVEDREHQIALLVSLQQIRFSIEKSLIKYAREKSMIKCMSYIRDLNIVHNLIWKIEQDVKNGKEVR